MTAPRCDSCGKFFRWLELGSGHHYVPDTAYSSEIDIQRCRPCTAREMVRVTVGYLSGYTVVLQGLPPRDRSELTECLEHPDARVRDAAMRYLPEVA